MVKGLETAIQIWICREAYSQLRNFHGMRYFTYQVPTTLPGFQWGRAMIVARSPGPQMRLHCSLGPPLHAHDPHDLYRPCTILSLLTGSKEYGIGGATNARRAEQNDVGQQIRSFRAENSTTRLRSSLKSTILLKNDYSPSWMLISTAISSSI